MPNPNQRRGSRLFNSIVFLLAGALTSIAVAWCIEIQVAYHGVPQDRTGETFWFPGNKRIQVCDLYRGFGRREYHLHWTFPNVAGLPPQPSASTDIPAWVKRPYNGFENLSGTYACGFPLSCMKWDYTDLMETSSTTTSQITYEFALPLYLPTRYCYARLPFHPLLAGLVANTIFYAAILCAIGHLLRQTRRHLRLRRGHCPSCNYDLRGQYTLCPECGTPLRSTPACEPPSAAS